jgi:hypothetical protein
MVVEVGLLLGGLEMMGFRSGVPTVQKIHQELKQAEKVVSQTLGILGGNKGGQQTMAELAKIMQDESLKNLEQVSREDMERNPFALPKGVHTLKELEEMARKGDEGAAEGAPKVDLKVTGIFLGKKEKTAIVGGNLVRVGDVIGSEQISEINPQGVILERDGSKRTLQPPALGGWVPAGEPLPLAAPKKAKSNKEANSKKAKLTKEAD